MSTFHIYRVFRYHAREVWSCELPYGTAALMKYSQRTPLKDMLSDVPPNVFPKGAITLLAHQFRSFWMTTLPAEQNMIMNNILGIMEAYPGSYHHAATQEMGIGFAIDGGDLNVNVFKKWPCYQWREMRDDGCFERKGLARNELATRKRNNKQRPAGVPDEIWRGL